MSNDDCFKNIKDQLSLNSETQLSKLNADIEAIKKLHASKGNLKSSHTIEVVRDVLLDFFKDKVIFFIDLISSMPIQYEKSLKNKLDELAYNFFDANFQKIDDRLKTIIEECGGQKFENRFLTALHQKRNLIHRELQNKLVSFILLKKEEVALSIIDRIIIAIEILCIIAIAFLAGKWSIDPVGNYEPYIVLIGIVTPLIEIGRRIWKKYRV